MQHHLARRSLGAIAGTAVLTAQSHAQPADPLPSWRDSPRRRALLDFVTAVTTPGGADFVPAPERIAVFDNDGTLWVEQPLYTQFIFILDRLRAMAPRHPEWQQDPLLRAALAGDRDAVASHGMEGLFRLAGTAQAGVSPEAMQSIAADWLATARDERWGRPYTALVFQPMLEVLAFLRGHGFSTFIVSGGGVEFVRAFAENTYGIPPHQVVGSSFALTAGETDGRVTLTSEPRVDFIDDGAGKPVGIARFIGRRPILAFGNSDGDFQMMQYTTDGRGRRLAMIVHHDDAAREYAYDRRSKIGHLSRALDEAGARGWQVISMREDRSRIFPRD